MPASYGVAGRGAIGPQVGAERTVSEVLKFAVGFVGACLIVYLVWAWLIPFMGGP